MSQAVFSGIGPFVPDCDRLIRGSKSMVFVVPINEG